MNFTAAVSKVNDSSRQTGKRALRLKYALVLLLIVTSSVYSILFHRFYSPLERTVPCITKPSRKFVRIGYEQNWVYRSTRYSKLFRFARFRFNRVQLYARREVLGSTRVARSRPGRAPRLPTSHVYNSESSPAWRLGRSSSKIFESVKKGTLVLKDHQPLEM